MSSIPGNKQELQQAITVSMQKLMLDYQRVPEGFSRTATIVGNVKGTQISICDTLAYLLGWAKLVLKWLDYCRQGKHIDFPDKGYKWDQLGLLAQDFHRQYMRHSFSQLLGEWQSATTDILTRVEQLDNQELYGQCWYKQWTMGRMIQLNTSSPMKSTRTKVRRFLREQL